MTSLRSEAAPYSTGEKRVLWKDHILCVIPSLLFLTAAITKTASFRELEATLVASQLIPVPLASYAAVSLLVLEYLLAILLLIPATRRLALPAATLLVCVFAAYSLWRWTQGIAVPCHCFGALFKLELWQSLSINVVLLGILGDRLSRRNV